MNNSSLVRSQYVICLFISLLYLLSAQSAQAAPAVNNIEIVTIDYPPLLGNKPTIISDITTAAFQAQGINANYKVYPLARVVRSIVSNSVTVALGSRNWFYKQDRDQRISFISIFWLNMRLFYLKSKFPDGLAYQHLSNLQKYKIGYIRGGALIPVFEAANIQPQLVPTLRQNLLKTYAGRDDMFAATELGGWAVINEYLADKKDHFSASEQPIHYISADIIFASEQRALYETFVQGFDIIKKNGTYRKIIEKYYHRQGVPDDIINTLESIY